MKKYIYWYLRYGQVSRYFVNNLRNVAVARPEFMHQGKTLV